MKTIKNYVSYVFVFPHFEIAVCFSILLLNLLLN